MAGSLAVLRDGFQGLANQVHITLIYIKAQQSEASSGTSTNTVQELESLTHQIVVCLVVLVAQKVLDSEQKNSSQSAVNLTAVELSYSQSQKRSTPAGPNCGSHRAAAGSVGLVS